MTASADQAPGAPRAIGIRSRIGFWWRRLVRQGRLLLARSSSTLTRQIVLLNLAGLIALAVGVLYLSQVRQGLVDSRVQSMFVQGEIMAGAIAATTSDSSVMGVDPDKLFELQLGESGGAEEQSFLEFPLSPERVSPILRRLTGPTKIQARLYDRDGNLLLDSRSIYGADGVLRMDIPSEPAVPLWYERWWDGVRRWLRGSDLAPYKDFGANNGRFYSEVRTALQGTKASMVRMNSKGEVIVSVAIPVQRFRGVLGVLMLNTQGGDIDQVLDGERLAVLKVFLVAAFVMIVLSVLLAGTIAGPVRRLAEGAQRVRRRTKSREEIPDFTHRGDEIGHLSGSLREMTDALYSRMEAIERFAADVAHELKNPLTSLRSAVETLPLAKSEESKKRLLDVIHHDVRRLDRLISDISDASRLDAELQRQDADKVDLKKLLTTIVAVANETRRGPDVSVTLSLDDKMPHVITGHDSRLGQVVNNLIDNARSFSPAGGTVRVSARRERGSIEITVDDDGPGIRDDALERIFERFYTDRPHQDYGQNSGLGLSISRQIVEAHGGSIFAQNRVTTAPDGSQIVHGARFTLRLPAA